MVGPYPFDRREATLALTQVAEGSDALGAVASAVLAATTHRPKPEALHFLREVAKVPTPAGSSGQLMLALQLTRIYAASAYAAACRAPTQVEGCPSPDDHMGFVFGDDSRSPDVLADALIANAGLRGDTVMQMAARLVAKARAGAQDATPAIDRAVRHLIGIAVAGCELTVQQWKALATLLPVWPGSSAYTAKAGPTFNTLPTKPSPVLNLLL